MFTFVPSSSRMRRIAALASLAVLIIASARGLEAQAADSSHVAVRSEKSPLLAGVLEWAVPTAGYAYAGHWSRGIPPELVRFTGVVLVLAQQYVGPFGTRRPCNAQCVIGTGMAVGGTIWAIADAAMTTDRENAKRRAPRSVSVVAPVCGRGGLGLSVRFSVGW